MLSNSRGLAAILSLSVSVLSSLILLFLQTLEIREIVVIFLISFVIGSGIIYAALELFIFRQINTLKENISQLEKGEVTADFRGEQLQLEAVRNFQEELLSFVDKKQSEIDRLKKIEAFRKEFIADVSHELKTPIFAAQGFLHTLLDGAVNDRTVRLKFLKKAAKSLDGLDALVQDLLVLSQIETGQIKMHFETIDLYQITEEVIEQFEDKVEKKRITFKLTASHHPVMVYGDAQRLTQVMTNLISNAIRHSFEDGEVIVHFEQTRKNINIKVQDFGEGIPEEHQDRIFERFYRVDKSRTKDKGKGGTGLGLSIVKHILEGHNTRAEVESSPGRGSIFSFKLPRFKAESEG